MLGKVSLHFGRPVMQILLVLPLVIPILIFGIAAIVGAVEEPAPFTGPFLLLCATTLFTSALGPIAASWMLRHSAD